MQRALDFDKTPALSVPLPFFINVPIFMAFTAILAIYTSPELLNSRWSSSSLALTHLWTLGILGSAMLGALMQILAVACNVPVFKARPIANISYVLLTTGTLALVSGFIWWHQNLWIIAACALGSAFTIYIVSIFAALWRNRQQVYKGAKEILIPVRLALLALTITVILGLIQVIGLANHVAIPGLIESHVLWGLVGWGGLLLIAMSFQLLPIFQLTELYPKSITKWLPFLVAGLLVSWSALDASSGLPRLMLETAEFLILITMMVWVGASLHRIWTRKRPKAEATSLFWFSAIFSMLACAPAWLLLNHASFQPAANMLGVLIIMGGLGSAVNGMLYKIVPFLLWKHAQDAMVIPDQDPRQARVYLKIMPKMASYIPDRPAQIQWALHTLAVIVWLLAATGWHAAKLSAGPILLVSALMLAFNMAKAIRLYRQTLKIMAALPHHQPR